MGALEAPDGARDAKMRRVMCRYLGSACGVGG
jgi:hypothetical protein